MAVATIGRYTEEILDMVDLGEVVDTLPNDGAAALSMRGA